MNMGCDEEEGRCKRDRGPLTEEETVLLSASVEFLYLNITHDETISGSIKAFSLYTNICILGRVVKWRRV